MKHFCILFLLSVFSLGWAQCPFGNGTRVECRLGCGNYIDENGKGYCDYSRLVGQETTDTATETIDAVALKQTKENINPKSAEVEQIIEEKASSISQNEANTTVKEVAIAATPPFKKPYHLILISMLTLGSYFFTFLLSRFGILHKIYHRRLWNTLLLLTAAISCLFGFFLAVQVNYGFLGEWYRPILTWHVECGIAMTIIAVFHVFWHISYYKQLFKRTMKSATSKE